ncbi:hypothetical protein DPMN_112711 [Dreissena polymorpha]|uniref:Uncharacterized protein n=1 Tax=Dreissena polymorpha TaxID=45954 RepID=A0A9D4KG57_DREPO|nr:hypothetical protein DPMN_112711 [Dreissena polymorpha]
MPDRRAISRDLLGPFVSAWDRGHPAEYGGSSQRTRSEGLVSAVASAGLHSADYLSLAEISVFWQGRQSRRAGRTPFETIPLETTCLVSRIEAD